MADLSDKLDALVPGRKLWRITYAIGQGKPTHTYFTRAKHAAIAKTNATLRLRTIHSAPIAVAKVEEAEEAKTLEP